MYIALLRGINVRGKRIKMARLKKCFEQMGFNDIKTYLQSGNVIFNHNSSDIAKMTVAIEKNLIQTFGFRVDVIIRTNNEFKSILDGNPFKDADIEPDKLYITYLKDWPDKKTVLDLYINKDENEMFEVKGREIYLYLPNGYARTKLTNNVFEKKLKTIATTRNWKTVNKLQELAN